MKQKHRPIYEISRDIAANWKTPYYGAIPYIEAMHSLDKPTDKYGADKAEDVLIRFLSNASTYRGDMARALKQEIREILATLQK